ncbi:trigger factor [Rhodoluna sp. KAS3]|uniref:trigger factor n=1 Tax=Rhodoluna sp. KAS3 TaxID=942880 RepID=UPI002230DB25|nr:trigger factor [Rhodoluna sp. KAS3]BDS49199.1 trigger factor [Rhodoluna sp. KAS3]
MKTAVEHIKPTRAKLTIEVTPEEFRPSIDHAYEHIAESVNIPGFRKGKVPAAILDQRVGRPAVLAHAINDGLDSVYRQALEESKLRPLGQPSADIKQSPDENTFEGNLIVEIEVEVRPELELKEYKGLAVKVDDIKVEAKEVEEELDALRARFGTLKTVERPAKKGDFTTIDLVAAIDGKTIDSAENISYEVGSGNLLDGIDEALDTLTAGESTTFKSKLVGGDQAGNEAEISVTLTAVKERELPAADDAFAQLASEFDTIAELKSDLEKQIERSKTYGQGIQARDLVTDKLLELIDVPVSDELVQADVNRHLEGEGRLEDDKHRAEVLEQSTRSFKVQMLLDAIAEKEELKVSEQELLQYLVQASQQYGMTPNDFIKAISEQGQVPMFVAEVARRKALTVVLEAATVTDSKGKAVDLSEFTKSDVQVADDHEGHDHD